MAQNIHRSNGKKIKNFGSLNDGLKNARKKDFGLSIRTPLSRVRTHRGLKTRRKPSQA